MKSYGRNDKKLKRASLKKGGVVKNEILILPFFSIPKFIILPGATRSFLIENKKWENIKNFFSQNKSNKNNISAFNLTEIDGQICDIGTVCVLKEIESDNNNKTILEAAALGIARIQNINTDSKIVKIKFILPFHLTSREWADLFNKNTFQENWRQIWNTASFLLNKIQFDSKDKLIALLYKKELAAENYENFIRHLNALFDYLLINSVASKNLFKNVLGYLSLFDADKHRDFFSEQKRSKEYPARFLETTMPAERQITFALKIIVRELKIFKKARKIAEEITIKKQGEENLFDSVEIYAELLERIIENLKELESVHKTDSEFSVYINKVLHEIKSKLKTKEEANSFSKITDYYTKKLKEISPFLTSPDDKKSIEDTIKKLKYLHPDFQEHSYIRNFLDYLLFTLPWGKFTQDNDDFLEVSMMLNEDHWGLQKQKERAIDYLAVRKLNPQKKGPILCFIGPPGVGKTSLGKSIARALSRKFIRISLGGVRDEADIRGHRLTYVGALPGRIINRIGSCGSSNPVFMIDEIDKLTKDFHGDPASALLEVLDPEQNNSFTDHYLGVGFDLSKVMFIATANIIDTIPKPLLDRMEIIKFHGYLDEEKLHIAKKFSIPKILKENGLPENLFKIFESKIVKHVILNYTREAGVRNLERALDGIARKLARLLANNEPLPEELLKEKIEEYLGVAPYSDYTKTEICGPGHVFGLAYTGMGGSVLEIETTTRERQKEFPEDSRISITGKVGDEIRESVKVALDLIKSKKYSSKLNTTDAHKLVFHIHIPEISVAKDGPSACLAILMSLISAVREIKAEPVAMTGEIDLLGKVLPIGGLKEKLLAAKREGITKIIIPKDNNAELRETSPELLKGLEIIQVSKIEEVLPHVFPSVYSLEQ